MSDALLTNFPDEGTLLEKAYLKGEAEGEAKGILAVLEVRAIPVSDDVRERIVTCTDLELVNGWLDRARTVTHAEELFAHDPEVTEDVPDEEPA